MGIGGSICCCSVFLGVMSGFSAFGPGFLLVAFLADFGAGALPFHSGLSFFVGSGSSSCADSDLDADLVLLRVPEFCHLSPTLDSSCLTQFGCFGGLLGFDVLSENSEGVGDPGHLRLLGDCWFFAVFWRHVL